MEIMIYFLLINYYFFRFDNLYLGLFIIIFIYFYLLLKK